MRPRFERLVEAKHEFDRTRVRMDVLGLATAGRRPGQPGRDRAEKAAGALQRAGRDDLERCRRPIHRRGCLIKDLDTGLLDFYALNGDRLVFLCWKLGEADVAHWHPLDGRVLRRASRSATASWTSHVPRRR